MERHLLELPCELRDQRHATRDVADDGIEAEALDAGRVDDGQTRDVLMPRGSLSCEEQRIGAREPSHARPQVRGVIEVSRHVPFSVYFT